MPDHFGHILTRCYACQSYSSVSKTQLSGVTKHLLIILRHVTWNGLSFFNVVTPLCKHIDVFILYLLKTLGCGWVGAIHLTISCLLAVSLYVWSARHVPALGTYPFIWVFVYVLTAIITCFILFLFWSFTSWLIAFMWSHYVFQTSEQMVSIPWLGTVQASLL